MTQNRFSLKYFLFLAEENEMKFYTRLLFRKKNVNIQDLILNETPMTKVSEEEQFLNSSKYFDSCFHKS